MQIKEGMEQQYKDYVAKNNDPYGGAVVTYSERWANMMESDTDGITGFMYGCAVAGLAQFWVHGESLRRWHNLKTQIGNEGEKANQSGGVLNPALLNISK